MLIAGIAGCLGKAQISELINLIMTGKGYKVSMTDSLAVSRLDDKKLGNYLSELSKSNVDILIIRIETPGSGTRLLNVMDFSVIIFTGITDDVDTKTINEYRDFMNVAFKLVNHKAALIVNVDGTKMEDLISGHHGNMVEYGFKSNSAITASSIGDMAFEGMLICYVQKALKDLSGKVVEPQERKIELPAGEIKVHNMLAAVAFDVITGMDNNKLHT